MGFSSTTGRASTSPSSSSLDGYESVMMSAITPLPPCTGRSSAVHLLHDGGESHSLSPSSLWLAFDQSLTSGLCLNCILDSYEMIADGEEHRVELLAIKKNFTMRVDGGKARSIINDGEKDMLKLTTPLFIGGLPSNVAATALNLWHLRNSTSFHGEWIYYGDGRKMMMMVIFILGSSFHCRFCYYEINRT